MYKIFLKDVIVIIILIYNYFVDLPTKIEDVFVTNTQLSR